MAAIYHMNLVQAIAIGLLQGITELFPVSSLGHTVLVPSWIGGTWATLVHQESQAESPYLAFVVGLHLATAFTLLAFYVREWVRLVVGLLRSIARRRVTSPEERLAWLIVTATVPVGALGLVFEHPFRVVFAKPVAAAVFLIVNGCVLLAGERHRRRHQAALELPEPGPGPGPSQQARRWRDRRIVPMDDRAERELSRIGIVSAAVIGASQASALLAGISREGVAMVGGLFRGLDNENAMRFSFLLSTPVIFAAGILKVPDLFGTLGKGIHGEVVAGSVAAVASSLFAIVFLSRYFMTRTLLPFAVYCWAFGLASVIRFGVF